MPHEKTRNSPDSCNVISLDRRRALTLSPGISRDSPSESPLKIPRRVSTAEDECVDTEMSKERKNSHSKIHWRQLAPNGTSSQSDPKSQKQSDQEHAILQEIHRRQIKVVLEDVLQTEIGQSFLSCQKTNQSESKRRSDHTSTAALIDKRRTSLTKRGETDSTGPEVSDNSCSPRESDSPQAIQISEQFPKQTKPSTCEVLLLEVSPQHEEAPSSGCESVCSHSSSSLATWGCLREKKSGGEFKTGKTPISFSPPTSKSSYIAVEVPTQCLQSEHAKKIKHPLQKKHLPSKEERRETQECPKYASDEKENYSLRNGEVVQEIDGIRGSVLRLSVGVDNEVPVKRCRMDSHLGEQVPSSDPGSGSVILESSKHNPSEPIVLSSEEEEEGEDRTEVEASALNIQPLEGAKDMNIEDKSVRVYKPKKHQSVICTQSSVVVKCQLSSLHMGGVSAACESVEITTEEITLLLKDSSVNISISTASVCKYSVWEEPILSGCGLVKDNEDPPPSLLFFWLSDAQAHQLHDDLSVILSGTSPAESSMCLLLCLAERLAGVDSAILASLMDFVVLNQSSSKLQAALTQQESLELLLSSHEKHLLQLLTPKTDPKTSTAEHTALSAVKSQDSDVQLESVYMLCHRRAQGSYSVTLEPTLGAEWAPYRHCGPARRLIQFPPPPSKGAITVTTEDLECLDSGEFLNDVIIDFYLKYLLVQKAPQASVDRSHVFSSFFYKQLTRRDNANEDSTSTPAQVRRHQRVRTWTRHVDIFDKDFLFVPVNQEAHWYLVVICFPGLEKPQYVKRVGGGSVQGDGGEGLGESEGEVHGENRSSGDEDKDDSRIKSSTSLHLPDCTENTCKKQIVCKRPCILIMDSLKLSVHERIFKLLREYLQVEWLTKRGFYRDFSVEHMMGGHCRVPLQDNSSDCGLYLLQYAESFLQDPVVHFDLPLRLERWFPRQQVRRKREEIRDLILHLYRFQQGSLGHEALQDRTDYGNVIE